MVARIVDRGGFDGSKASSGARLPTDKLGRMMRALRALSRAIDAINRHVGRASSWPILAAVLVSAGNAVSRKAFDMSSNAWLEVQWYLYAAAFLCAAGYVLMVDEHVRVDVLAQRFAPKARAVIDVVALLLFVLPLCVLMVDLGGAYFWRAFVSGESSFNAGGLIRWPVYFCIPAGFALLGLQAVSELIKRIDFILGHREHPGTSESELPAHLGEAPP